MNVTVKSSSTILGFNKTQQCPRPILVKIMLNHTAVNQYKTTSRDYLLSYCIIWKKDIAWLTKTDFKIKRAKFFLLSMTFFFIYFSKFCSLIIYEYSFCNVLNFTHNCSTLVYNLTAEKKKDFLEIIEYIYEIFLLRDKFSFWIIVL